MSRTMVLLLAAIFAGNVSAGQVEFDLVDITNDGVVGHGYYDPSGLSGDVFGLVDYPFLTIPAPGPKTGLTPKVAAWAEFRVRPETITGDDFGPVDNPSQTYRFSLEADLFAPIAEVPYHLSSLIDLAVDDYADQWIYNEPLDTGHDTWIYLGFTSLTVSDISGILAFVTTDDAILQQLDFNAGSTEVLGGGGTTTFAVPEASSWFMIATASAGLLWRTRRISGKLLAR